MLANHIKILLVEDDEDDYLLTKEAIEDFGVDGFTLTWQQNFDEAFDTIKSQQHDVYLIDYRLGAESGLELVEKALNHGILGPFIMLTGQQDAEIDERARKAGAVDYLVKGKIDAFQLERSIRYGIQNINNLKKIKSLNEELERRVAARTEALAKSNEALKESQRLYKSIANNFPDGVIQVIDKSLNYVFVDGNDFHLFKLPMESIIGQNVATVMQEPARSTVINNFKKALAGSKTTFELTFPKDITYECSAVPLVYSSDAIDQILVVCKNITQKKRAEHEIKKALEKEKQLGELKSRFVTTASHEFRTPLSTILSSVSLIDRYNTPSTYDSEKVAKHIHRIKSSVNNLNQILNDFLSMGQLEEGRIEYQPVLFDLNELVNEAIAGLRPLLKEGQNIDCELTCDEKQVYLDKQMVRNVMINLVSNAIKYSKENANILLKTSCINGIFSIIVKDKGIGIPQSDIKHIFERFFRANNAVNIQGTGLGLNIVKRYVELMKGKIYFESQEGIGTTFFVEIPITQL